MLGWMAMRKRLIAKALICTSLLLPSFAFANNNLTIADAQGDWGVLAPFLHSARGPGFVYTSFLFDSLIWKATDGKLQPLLAQSWQLNEVSQCYEFKLHPDAVWQDGQAVTAEDVVFSFDYLKKHGYRFVDLEAVDHVSQLATKGEGVAVCMKQDYAPFLTNIAASLPIIPAHIYASITDPLHFSTPQAATGSGAYQLVEYNRAKGYYRLKAHADYHSGTPAYDEVRIVRMSPQAALSAMKKGQVDVISLPQPLVKRYQEAGFKVTKALSNHPTRLLFNHQGLFADVSRRQGLAYFIDRQTLVDIAYQGEAEIARVGYRQTIQDKLSNAYSKDPKKAATLLQASGWSTTTKGKWLGSASKPLVLRLLATPNSELLAITLADQLESAGFSVALRLEPDLQLAERLAQGEYDLALLSSSHEGDPDRFRLMLTGQQQRGDGYLADKALLKLLDEQQQTLEPKKRDVLLLEAETIYSQQLPSLPLVNAMNFVAFNPDKVHVEFTQTGIALGIPLPYNKTALFFTTKPANDLKE